MTYVNGRDCYYSSRYSAVVVNIVGDDDGGSALHELFSRKYAVVPNLHHLQRKGVRRLAKELNAKAMRRATR